MVRTEERRDHYEEVKWHQRESDGEPPSQDDALVPHVKTLAAGENAPRITGLRDSGQHERAEVSTALELILDGQPTRSIKTLGPLAVDLPFQVESALLVSDVTGSDEEGKADP